MTLTGRELWLRGQASTRFETELQNLGWGLRQQVELSEKIKEPFTQPSQQKERESSRDDEKGDDVR